MACPNSHSVCKAQWTADEVRSQLGYSRSGSCLSPYRTYGGAYRKYEFFPEELEPLPNKIEAISMRLGGLRGTRRKTILALMRVIKVCPAASGRE